VLALSEAIVDVDRAILEKKLDDGTARRLFDRLVEEQGGCADDLPNLANVHKAPVIREFPAKHTGTIRAVDAGLVGQASLQLGAGRAKATDDVDFAVGFDRLVKSGEPIQAGKPICRIHARTDVDFDMAAAMIEKAVVIG